MASERDEEPPEELPEELEADLGENGDPGDAATGERAGGDRSVVE
jgi:hypothetical protein